MLKFNFFIYFIMVYLCMYVFMTMRSAKSCKLSGKTILYTDILVKIFTHIFMWVLWGRINFPWKLTTFFTGGLKFTWKFQEKFWLIHVSFVGKAKLSIKIHNIFHMCTKIPLKVLGKVLVSFWSSCERSGKFLGLTKVSICVQYFKFLAPFPVFKSSCLKNWQNSALNGEELHWTDCHNS